MSPKGGGDGQSARAECGSSSRALNGGTLNRLKPFQPSPGIARSSASGIGILSRHRTRVLEWFVQCHCGKPAILKIQEGVYLCMECLATFQRTIQENQRLNFAMLNYLEDEMAFMVGLPRIGPRIKVPMPTYIGSAPLTMNTTNNIRVESGSQVGQINAGAIVYLDGAVTAFTGAGLKDLAASLKTFTQQVVDSKELSSATQKEILDLLRALVEQVPKKKEDRNPTIWKLALQSIGPLLSAGSAIATHWETLKQLFEHLFRL